MLSAKSADDRVLRLGHHLPIFDACYGDGGVVNEAGVVRHSSLDSLLDIGLFTYIRQKKLSPAKIADMDINNF